MKRLRRSARLLADVRGPLLTSLVVSLAQSALLVPVPLVIKHVFDTDLRHADGGAVARDGAIVLVLYVASAALGLWTRYAVLKATKRAIASLRFALLEKLYQLPRSFHDRRPSGELHATIVQDSERLDIIANAVLGLMLPAVVVAVGLSVVGLVLDPLLFGILACAILPALLVNRVMRGRVQARTRQWQLAFDRFSAQTQLALRTRVLAEVRAAESTELHRQRKHIDALSATGVAMAWRQSAWGITQGAIVAAAAVVVLVIGGAAVAGHHMSLGGLISFYAIVALLQSQLGTIAAMVPLAVSGEESIERLSSILDLAEPPAYRGTRRIDFDGAIELAAVSFGYESEPLLCDIELSIDPGEHVLIVGRNGAGKSTLAHLILGLYRPWSGQLRADGIPYDELDLQVLRRRVGVVLQDPVILPATVTANISYGRPDANPYEVRRAAEMAGALEFIEQLPQGFETWVGDEGQLLSGGQRQRLAIARALIGEPRLLILDEPTTHLDRESVAMLRETLAALPGQPPVLIISHDDSLGRPGDRVLELRDGGLQAISDSRRLELAASAE